MGVTREAARQREIARRKRAEMRRAIDLANLEPFMEIARLYDEMVKVIKDTLRFELFKTN